MAVDLQAGRLRVLPLLDASGASLSTLCAVHCALTPLVVAVLPLLGLGFLADQRTEAALMGLSAALGLASGALGFRVHRSRRTLAVLAAGLMLLAVGRLAERAERDSLGTALAVGGGLAIATAHLLSRRLCRPGRAGIAGPRC